MAKHTDITYPTWPQPRQVRLDTTTKCNAKCPTCHKWGCGRDGEMDSVLFCKVLSDIAKWEEPLQEIIPVNYGELFMRSDAIDLLFHISRVLPQTQIVLPTNGSLITPEILGELMNIPTLRIINFSINAYFDESYEHFMGFDPEVLYRIKTELVTLIRVYRPDIKIWASMVFDPRYHTDYERDAFMGEWIGRVDQPWVLAASSTGIKGQGAKWPVKLPCRSIFSDMVIGYDGKLSSCCFDAGFTLDLGEYTGDIRADWHNEKMENIRRVHNDHKRDTIPLCRSCTSA